jgi:hypothetical protein
MAPSEMSGRLRWSRMISTAREAFWQAGDLRQTRSGPSAEQIGSPASAAQSQPGTNADRRARWCRT